MQQSKDGLRFCNAAEMLSLLLCTSVLFTFYNPVGELARQWRSEGPSVFERIDAEFDWMTAKIPYVPSFVVPYVLVYAMPALYLAAHVDKHGLGKIAAARRFFFHQMALIVAAFALYLAFPTETDLIPAERAAPSTAMSKVCVDFVHKGISQYVACPSMHVAHAASIAMAFRADGLRGASFAKAMAHITYASTLLTKAHPLPHIFFGFLLALGAHAARDLFKCATEPAQGTWVRGYAAAVLPVVFLAVGHELHELAGWQANVPAMFGFERLHCLTTKFYGFYCSSATATYA